MKRLALLSAFIVALIFPVSASAAVTQYASGSCTQAWNAQGNPVPFVCLAEDEFYSGDKLTLTGSSDIPTLRLLNHTPGGLCSPKVYPFDDTWGDCISSVWAKLGTNDSICLFRNDQYRELIWWAHAPSSPSGSVWTYGLTYFSNNNDATSSVMLQQSGTSCNAL